MLIAIGSHLFTGPAHAACKNWPLWQAYQSKFIQADGRVIDYQQGLGVTTSEGQAYSLFFALVANDRNTFDSILQWTETQLAGGDLRQKLPAWRWGQHGSGAWQVLDSNSAADADLWLAYTLMEAGRLWGDDKLTAKGYRLLALVKRHEVVYPPGLGPMLLPGRRGFALPGERWLLNPSYLPVSLLRSFQHSDPDGPWARMIESTIRLLAGFTPHRLAPDWVVYDAAQGWSPDAEKGPLGSYDAIRTYLWAGMLSEHDSAKAQVMETIGGMAELVQTHPDIPPPEYVNTVTAKFWGRAPAGFSAALLPYLATLNMDVEVERQVARLKRKSRDNLVGEHGHYYDQVLALFGVGWHAGYFRFAADGSLAPAWARDCLPTQSKNP